MYHVHAANVSAIPTDMDTGDAPGDLFHGKGVSFQTWESVLFFLSKIWPGKLFLRRVRNIQKFIN